MYEILTSLTLEQVLFMVASISGVVLWAIGVLLPVGVLFMYGWMRFVHLRDAMQYREVPALNLSHFSLIMVIFTTAFWLVFYLIVTQTVGHAEIGPPWYTTFCFFSGATAAGYVGSAWLRYPVLPTSLVNRLDVFAWSFGYLVTGVVFLVTTLFLPVLGGG